MTVQTDTYVAAKIAEVRGKLAVLKENKEQAGKPATAVKQRKPQGQNKINNVLKDSMVFLK